jgi:hypothetical protein
MFELRLKFFFIKKIFFKKKNEKLLYNNTDNKKLFVLYKHPKHIQLDKQTNENSTVKTKFFIKGVLFYYFANHSV